MLLEELKDELKITWDFEDNSLSRLIERGKVRIKELTGTELDFTEESLQKELLFNYCRYSYNNATEYFLENFSKEILELQLKEAIKQSKAGDSD